MKKRYTIMISIAIFLSVTNGSILAQSTTKEQPISFFLLFDDSASMGQRSGNPAAESWGIKIDDVRKQSAEFFQAIPLGAELYLYSFSEGLTRGPSIVISAKNEFADRKRANDFLRELQINGQKTRFWWSLERVLDDAASHIKQKPNAIVRVIAYTDGQDNDPNRINPQEVLKKHSDLLKEHVQLTYVAIGFELSADEKQILEKANVNVRVAMKPSDAIPVPPPHAQFRISNDRIQLGQTITIVNESTGDGLKFDWRLGDSKPSHQTHPSITPKKTGSFPLTLRVTDSLGRADQTQQLIEVVAKPTPQAEFIAAVSELRVNQKIRFINQTTGKVDRFTWIVDGKQISTDRDLEMEPTEAGYLEIELVATTDGESSSRKQRFAILPLKLPSLKIVGAEQVDYGKNVKLTCIAEQNSDVLPVIEWEWYCGDHPVGTGSTLTFTGEVIGPHELRCVIKTGNGPAEATHRLTVNPPPQPMVELDHPREIFVDESATIKADITGLYEAIHWFVDEKETGDRSNLIQANFEEPEPHAIRIEVTGLGGVVTTQSGKIEVKRRPTPIGGFLIGKNNLRVGDEVVIVDESVHADWVDYYLDEKWISRIDYSKGDDRYLNIKLLKAGKEQLRQVVTGKGGSVESTQWLVAMPMLIAPQSCLHHQLVSTDAEGNGLVEFQLSATGQIEQVEADFGNGFTPLEPTTGSFQHSFPPGKQKVAIRVTGAPEFAAELHEVAIEIAHPWPKWTQHLWWIGLVTIAFGTVASFGFSRFQARKQRNDLEKIVGNLKTRPLGEFDNWQDQPFIGDQKKEIVILKNGQQVWLRSAFNSSEGKIGYFLSLDENAPGDTDVEINSNEPVEFCGHEFCYLRSA